MNILLIDMTNLARKNAFAMVKKDVPFEGWEPWATRTLGDIMDFVSKFHADRCILAMDDAVYWRTKIFPEYKANRRQFKEDSIVDFDSLDAYYDAFMVRFQNIFTNIFCLKVPRCEADDVIAVLTKAHAERGDACTIISADKDFNQLKKYPGVVHYNPVMRKEILMLNPQRSLDIKIICGDPNDGIPPIRRGIGVKTAEKILNAHTDIPNSSDTLLVENFQRNKQLIDFDFIPKEIISDIILEYEKENVYAPISPKIVFPFVMEHRTIDSWQRNQMQVIKLI
jgi:5'-3' exonuclease